MRFHYKKKIHNTFYVLFFITIAVFANGQTLSVLEKEQQSSGPRSLGTINAQLEESVARHLAISKEISKTLNDAEVPIARMTVCDYCCPEDLNEYKALGGVGLILITAISHSKAELPLTRAYFKVNGYLIELVRLKYVLSKQSSSNSIVAKVYGEFRSDELYILPIPLLEFKPVLKVDFAKNRTGLELITFELPNLGFTPTVIEKKINPEKIHEFAKREYPGVF